MSTFELTSEVLYAFWSQVDIQAPGGCWDWIGTRNKQGYGWFAHKGAGYAAHRFAWMIANRRSIPKKEVIRHTCDRPCCVNPEHLLIGNQSDNLKDCVQRGRHLRQHGSEHGMAILNEEQVIEIKRLLSSGYSRSEVAREFGVSHGVIYNIATGRSWGWLIVDPADDL